MDREKGIIIMEKAALEYLIEHPLENVTATLVIKESLCKQIPEQVIINGNDYSDALLCPRCNSYVGSNEDGICGNYCQECGQRLTR